MHHSSAQIRHKESNFYKCEYTMYEWYLVTETQKFHMYICVYCRRMISIHPEIMDYLALQYKLLQIKCLYNTNM